MRRLLLASVCIMSGLAFTTQSALVLLDAKGDCNAGPCDKTMGLLLGNSHPKTAEISMWIQNGTDKGFAVTHQPLQRASFQPKLAREVCKELVLRCLELRKRCHQLAPNTIELRSQLSCIEKLFQNYLA